MVGLEKPAMGPEDGQEAAGLLQKETDCPARGAVEDDCAHGRGGPRSRRRSDSGSCGQGREFIGPCHIRRIEAGILAYGCDMWLDNNPYEVGLGYGWMVDLEQKADFVGKEALKRIKTSEYGLCANCQEELLPKRLEAVPWAKHCVTCQEKKEQGLL